LVPIFRQKVVTDGKVEVSDHIERGRFLLYPEDEWKRRCRPIEAKLISVFAFIFSVFLVLPAIPLVFSRVVRGVPFFSGQLLVFWVLFTIFISITIAFFLIVRYSFHNVIPALYENGVQTIGRLFVPYDEIDRVKVEEEKGLLTWSSVRMISTSEGHPDISDNVWMFPYAVLGPDGLVHLQVLIGDIPGKSDPPELHVHRPRKGLQGKG